MKNTLFSLNKGKKEFQLLSGKKDREIVKSKTMNNDQ